jgi:tetratricopeptide (TPR) repeat protein
LTEQPSQQNDPNLIPVYDKYGRQLFVTKETWRTDVLPGTIQANWDNPDQLYNLIIAALNDGFRADILEAAKHLYDVDAERLRAANLWGIVLMEEGRLDEAEHVFNAFIRQHGESGVILTNLAKVFAKRGDETKAEQTLWHALEVDPNQSNALGWYHALNRERGGDEAGIEAWRRVAALPASWRAQLWLARRALSAKRPDEALSLYRSSLARLPAPVPTDVLQQISGDLGNAGLLAELLQLSEPRFDPVVHGLDVGNNLIKANLDLGRIDAAKRILDQLYALKRPDWQQHLGFWDTEIARRRLAESAPDAKTQLTMTVLTIDGPVWLDRNSPVASLFAAKPPDAPCICFLGSSAEIADAGQNIERQLAEARGRLSRSLPLFLAEQIFFATEASSCTLIPWIVQPSAGFILSGGAESDRSAADLARKSDARAAYVVTTHLICREEPWGVELRVVRTADDICVGHLQSSVTPARPEETLPQLSRKVADLLAAQSGVRPLQSSRFYEPPTGQNFGHYLLRLEQLLAVRCSAMNGAGANFLHGEREIVAGNIDLALSCPQNVAVRLVLAQTLRGLNRVRPDIVIEFRDTIKMLRAEHPLAGRAQQAIEQLFDSIFAASAA